MEVNKISKKDKKSKSNKMQNSNNTVECNSHGHDTNLTHECGKENCSCTKQNNCSSLTTKGE